MDKQLIQDMRDSWDTIQAISDYFWEPYWRMRRHMISVWVIWETDASERYNGKRIKKNIEIIKKAKELYKDWRKTTFIANELWVEHKTLLTLMKNKKALGWVRMYNWVVTDYWDGTRQCINCKQITSKLDSKCQDCK